MDDRRSRHGLGSESSAATLPADEILTHCSRAGPYWRRFPCLPGFGACDRAYPADGRRLRPRGNAAAKLEVVRRKILGPPRRERRCTRRLYCNCAKDKPAESARERGKVCG